MGSIKLPHASGNSMSIAAPATNPASDLELKLPATIGSANQFLKNSGTAGTLEFASLVEDSSGKVGIGTTSPDDTLVLSGSTGYGLKVIDGTHTGVFRTVSGGAILKTASNHALVFGTNDTERVRIDSGGRILKGVTTAEGSRNNTSTRYPHVQLSSPWSSGLGSTSITCTDDYPVVFLNSNASYANNSGAGVIAWSIKDGAGNYCNTASIESKIDGTPGNNDSPGELIFSTTTDGTCNPVEAMRIDSSGNVTKPTSSKFAAKVNYQNAFLSGGTILQFDSTTNEGSDYSNSTERYTAPVDGFYAFWFFTNVTKQNGAGAFYTDWYKNGSNIVNTSGGRIYGNWEGSWENHSGFIGLHLDAGDYVSVHAGDSNAKYDGGAYGQFMGWLVG